MRYVKCEANNDTYKLSFCEGRQFTIAFYKRQGRDLSKLPFQECLTCDLKSLPTFTLEESLGVNRLCKGCQRSIEHLTRNRQYCDECRTELNQKYRVAAKRRLEKLRPPKVCLLCGKNIDDRSYNAIYCYSCAEQRAKEYQNKRCNLLKLKRNIDSSK